MQGSDENASNLQQETEQCSKNLQIFSGPIESVGNLNSQEFFETKDITIQLQLYKGESLIDLSRVPELEELDCSDQSNHQTLGEILNSFQTTLLSANVNCKFTKITIGREVTIPIENNLLVQPIKCLTKATEFQIEAQVLE